MTEHYDAIVIGAGPAGSTAARELADAGATTLLVERAKLPRYKTCAGGVPLRTAFLLPFSLDPVIEDVVDRMAVSLRGGARYVRHAAAPYAYMTMRARLDGLLAAKAAAAGVDVRDETAVRSVERDGAEWRLVTAGGVATADYLIGADGANSLVARSTSLGAGLSESVAMEAEIRAPAGAIGRWRRTVGIDLGYQPSGYAWVFPKEDLLSLGLVLPKSEGPTIRDQLAAFVRTVGLDAAPCETLTGHKVLFRRGPTPIAGDSVALVGDAAGLADELSEEGIYYAVRSGQMVAHAIASSSDRDLRSYTRAVDAEIQPELDAARAIANWVYRMLVRWPHAVMFASHYIDYLWRAAFRVQRGESDYARELDRLPAPLRRLGAVLTR